MSIFLCVGVFYEIEVGMERREEEHLLLTEIKVFCFSEINQ